jgi:hypothetical protein
MERQKLTVTDYVIRADGVVIKAEPSLREARLYIKRDLVKAKEVPQVVELLKRTTTQKVLNVYVNKPTETLVAASALDLE